jgi:uncharacterized protein YacL
MFVEITRLLIVLLFTATGFTLARGSGTDPSNAAIVGATLGALVGYVVGGVLGRLLNKAMGALEDRVERTPAAGLLAGTVGATALGVPAGFITLPLFFLVTARLALPVTGVFMWGGAYVGFRLGVRKATELLGLAGLSTRPLALASKYGSDPSPDAFVVDTSAVIDGRLLTVASAGFLRGSLLVPRFVLDELQGIADAQDVSRRRRGRRGLESLDALQKDPRLNLHVLDDEVPEFDAVDAKLVALARRLRVGLVTTDGNLQRVAELQGVPCLNPNKLAEGLRPQILAGDVVTVPISKQGREPGQGVGFLDDGTMVVVGDAAALVGQDVDVKVSSNVQTSQGRMLFASLDAG